MIPEGSQLEARGRARRPATGDTPGPSRFQRRPTPAGVEAAVDLVFTVAASMAVAAIPPGSGPLGRAVSRGVIRCADSTPRSELGSLPGSYRGSWYRITLKKPRASSICTGTVVMPVCGDWVRRSSAQLQRLDEW